LCKHVVGLGIQSKSSKTPIAPNSCVARNLALGVQLENFVLSSLDLGVQMPHCTPSGYATGTQKTSQKSGRPSKARLGL